MPVCVTRLLCRVIRAMAPPTGRHRAARGRYTPTPVASGGPVAVMASPQVARWSRPVLPGTARCLCRSADRAGRGAGPALPLGGVWLPAVVVGLGGLAVVSASAVRWLAGGGRRGRETG